MKVNNAFVVRVARNCDVTTLERLVPLSVRTLLAPYYSADQIEGALGPVLGVDRHLISDGTYFVVETKNSIIACGGWSMRKALFGGDKFQPAKDELLDPFKDPARIRAFFVHPDWARHGLGSLLIQSCETAALAAGFTNVELVATLAGEPLYRKFSYIRQGEQAIPLPNGLALPVIHMTKQISRPYLSEALPVLHHSV